LLKAFSFFKKRQKSNLQLLIATNSSAHFGPFAENLKTYKYRNDVKLFKDLTQEELQEITRCAYAFLYPVLFENSGIKILQAMKWNTPLILSDLEIFHEICTDATLYVDPNNFENIADKMMLLFKDEKKRAELIEKGIQQSQQFNIQKSLEQLWQSILKTAQ